MSDVMQSTKDILDRLYGSSAAGLKTATTAVRDAGQSIGAQAIKATQQAETTLSNDFQATKQAAQLVANDASLIAKSATSDVDSIISIVKKDVDTLSSIAKKDIQLLETEFLDATGHVKSLLYLTATEANTILKSAILKQVIADQNLQAHVIVIMKMVKAAIGHLESQINDVHISDEIKALEKLLGSVTTTQQWKYIFAYLNSQQFQATLNLAAGVGEVVGKTMIKWAVLS